MSLSRFKAEEVLFSPTAKCNLSCGHCDVPKGASALSVKHAERFLLQCRRLGVKRVGFTGGEPFLALDFLCSLTRMAVKEGLTFDRIMTNGVWWSDEDSLKTALVRLYNAGYDGTICVSVDAFHKQSVKKAARLTYIAACIWRRPDIVSIAYVRGARDDETRAKLTTLKAIVRRADRRITLKMCKMDIVPVGKAAALTDAWDGRWFKEDYCRGPGNVFFVTSNGDVKPCCGYATNRKELSIGNIMMDSGNDILGNFRHNRFVNAIFSCGLSKIRQKLESEGVSFPGKTSSHCFFCNYILTKIPRNILLKSLAALCAIVILFSQASLAQDLKLRPGKDFHKIASSVVKRVKVPKGYHEGLFYDGKSLWLANGEKGSIWVIDPATGEVISSMEPVADFAEALIRTDDGMLFTTEWYEKKIYRVKMEGAKLIPELECSLEPAHPTGIAWDGKRLFVVTWTRGIGTKFHLLEMNKDLSVTSRIIIKGIQEPDQLTWDGKHLWISSWYTDAIYQVDVDGWEITGYIGSPVSKTTGIAWDGKYMWVTGTRDDLYMMEIGK